MTDTNVQTPPERRIVVHATTTPSAHDLLREVRAARADAEREIARNRAILDDTSEGYDDAWTNDTYELIDQQLEVLRVLDRILERAGADVPHGRNAA